MLCQLEWVPENVLVVLRPHSYPVWGSPLMAVKEVIEICTGYAMIWEQGWSSTSVMVDDMLLQQWGDKGNDFQSVPPPMCAVEKKLIVRRLATYLWCRPNTRPTGWKLKNTRGGLARMDVPADMGAKKELEEIIQWKSGPLAVHCCL